MAKARSFPVGTTVARSSQNCRAGPAAYPIGPVPTETLFGPLFQSSSSVLLPSSLLTSAGAAAGLLELALVPQVRVEPILRTIVSRVSDRRRTDSGGCSPARRAGSAQLAIIVRKVRPEPLADCR